MLLAAWDLLGQIYTEGGGVGDTCAYRTMPRGRVGIPCSTSQPVTLRARHRAFLAVTAVLSDVLAKLAQLGLQATFVDRTGAD